MKYLKLFEQLFEEQEELEEIFYYFSDDLNLTYLGEEIGDGFEFRIHNFGKRFRFDGKVKQILDLVVKFCKRENFDFRIKLMYEGRTKIDIDMRGNEEILLHYIGPDYRYSTKKIESITQIRTDRWVDLIKIDILKKGK